MVVLPDYQGLGISRFLTMFICDMLKNDGKKWITTTSNLARINTLKKNNFFRCTHIGRKSSGSGRIQNKYKKGSTSNARITVSFEYVG